MRKFEVVCKYKNAGINLPIRKTKFSAGYDVESAVDIRILPYKMGDKPVLIPTGIKFICEDDEFLMLVNRSGGPKKGLYMANGIGIIDKDYYNNETNEGEIFFQYINPTDAEIFIKKGTVIGQAIFMKYLTTDDDAASGIRTGGFGSTDKQ